MTGAPTVLVLAGGRGRRWTAAGGPGSKLHALLNGRTVLQHVLDAVADAGLDCHLQAQALPSTAASIAAGVRATPDASGWMVLPGDLPRIRAATLRTLAAHFAAEPAVALRAVHAGRPAHPVVFPADCLADLLRLGADAPGSPGSSDGGGDGGARAVLHRLRAAGRLREIAVDDPGTAADVDTPAALAAMQRL